MACGGGIRVTVQGRVRVRVREGVLIIVGGWGVEGRGQVVWGERRVSIIQSHALLLPAALEVSANALALHNRLLSAHVFVQLSPAVPSKAVPCPVAPPAHSSTITTQRKHR